MVIYSDKFLDSVSWFMKVGGITLFPFIILRKKYKKNKIILNHESIHLEQQKELLVVGFYIWYLVEWIIRLFMRGNAYKSISFEKEAYTNQRDLNYLKTRKRYNWLR